MKVNSIRGTIPEGARPPKAGPGIETQADITNRLRPREDISEKVFDKSELPMLAHGAALCGAKLDKVLFSKFVSNTLRARPLVQEWLLNLGSEVSGNVTWRVVIGPKDVKKYSTADLGTILADHLVGLENVAAVRISTTNGVQVGSTQKKVSGDSSLSLWYKKIS